MEAKTQTSAVSPLEMLRAELGGRGWHADLEAGRPELLCVRNPNVARLNDKVTCEGGLFRWAWGQGITEAEDVTGAADRIIYVLRAVGE